MLQAALRSGAAQRRCVFEVFARRLPEGRRYGVVAGTGRLVEAVRDFRFGADELAALRERGVVDEQTLDFLAGYRFSGDISGYAEGECYFPGSPARRGGGLLRRGRAAGDADPLDPQPRRGGGRGRLADGHRRRRPPLPGDGLAPHPRAGGGRRRPRGLRGRVRRHQQPRGGADVRRADRRHERARVHPAARHRARRVRGAGGLPGQGHDPAGRHLRRAHRGRGRGRRRRTRAGGRAAGLRRPAHPGRRGPGAAGLAGRHRHPDRGDRPTWTSTPSRPSPPPRSTPTVSARRWSPAPARPPPGSSTSWSPAPTTAARWWTWPRRARTRPPSAAGSGPCAGAARTAWPRPRWSGSASSRSTTATTGRCWSSCCAAARWSATDLDLQSARERHERAMSELPPRARRLSRGEPAIPTLYENIRG